METSVEHGSSNESQPGLITSIGLIMKDISGWLAEQVSLTEDDLVKAGIYFGDEGPDE